MSWWWAGVPAVAAGMGAVATATVARRRHADRWLLPLLASRRLPAPRPEGQPVHVFLAMCDHYEPQWGKPAKKIAIERVERWRNEYPRLFARFADSSGRPPQHTFFFPADEYQPEYLDLLAELCHEGYGDVDVHLHHHNDTAENLRETLEAYKETLSNRHGLLRRDAQGQLVYGFIHGNWALCDSRRDRCWCGIERELTVLRETGCYADFTMPSAPADGQTKIVNSIYYSTERGRRSNDHGQLARVGQAPPNDSLLMVQGPLGFNWRDRKWGLVPRLENADIHKNFAPTWQRMQLWTDIGVRVQGRADWVFVKLHTHGAKPGNIDLWLGDKLQAFHGSLEEQRIANPAFHYHYVTAWEMAQLVHAAEAGVTDPAQVLAVCETSA